jgi:hypothetical protein
VRIRKKTVEVPTKFCLGKAKVWRSYQIFSFFFLIFALNCGKDRVKLPDAMPNDVEIILIEKRGENRSESFAIRAETEKILIQETGGIHNSSAKKRTKISRQEIEKLYQFLLENGFDRIEQIDGKRNTPIEEDREIAVYFDQKSVVVYNGLLQLSAENKAVFEKIRQEILTTAKKGI